MHKQVFVFLVIVLFLSSCVSVQVGDPPTPTPAGFVTATLAPTKAGFVPPTITPSLEATAPPTLAVTIPPNCTNSATLLRDVTIQDGTRVNAGETFKKTWEFQNTGTCPWIGYTFAFSTGERMNAPLSAPVPDTLPKGRVEVSVDLTAPTANGVYTGFFTLNDPNGNIVFIGTEQSFWVKIVVGSGAHPAATLTGSSAQATPTAGGGTCNFSQNAGYVSQIASLINEERTKAGLPALTINSLLTNAAQSHAADMACNSRISHTGSDGSSVYSRVIAAGYSPSSVEEIIYGGGGPQAAMTWWMNDKIHRDAILKARSTDMGVGYAYFASGSYGDYIVVVFASP